MQRMTEAIEQVLQSVILIVLLPPAHADKSVGTLYMKIQSNDQSTPAEMLGDSLSHFESPG